MLGSNSFEVLNKSLPGSSTYIVNNQILLITSCEGASNGYTCHCSNSNTTIYSSLCYPINSNLTSMVLDANSILGYPNFSLPKTDLLSNLRTVLLLSELPQFQLIDTYTSSNVLFEKEQFGTYIQIKTNYIRNNQGAMSSTVMSLATLGLNNMKDVFSPFESTVLAGPGYYFKFNPVTL